MKAQETTTAAQVPARETYENYSQYAERLGVSTKHIQRLVASGDLPVLRLGKRCIRIPVTAADARLRAMTQDV